MTDFRLNFTHPWLLLLLIPALVLTLIPYFRVTKKYRRTRNRIISVVMHALAMVLCISLLAGISFSYEIANPKNEVILLVDVSYSNEDVRDQKDQFVKTIADISNNDFKLGIVKFGYDQKYVAKLTTDTQKAFDQYKNSEDPDTSATDLASALKYTKELFKNPTTGKIVVISDGIETDGEANSVIKSIAAEGIKVDTVYFPNEELPEVQVIDVKTPDYHILLDEEFAVQLTVQHNYERNAEQPVKITVYDNDELIHEMSVYLTYGTQNIDVNLTLSQRGMHELKFTIENDGDTLTQNNAYHSYINLEVFENVLIIERMENESQELQNILNDSYNVTTMSVEEDVESFPADIFEMAEFEQVVLVNIAYSDMPMGFEELLNEYVYEYGGGLFTVGGVNDATGVDGKLVPHAYNRQDMERSTYYKQMLPVNAVDFTPPIAVMVVIDASASMAEKLDSAKEGAIACLDALNDRDYCGVMSFQSRSVENLSVIPVSNRDKITEAIQDIRFSSASYQGTIFSDAIMNAGNALSVINDVERRHIILITDGKSGDSESQYKPYILQNMERDITMSIVTVDVLPNERAEMAGIVGYSGGKYYDVAKNDMHMVGQYVQQDLAMTAVAEIEYGESFNMTIKDHTSVTSGILEQHIPTLEGYYGTVAKEGAVVPLMGKYVPIYAQWKYGEGNVGSFMSELNGVWSSNFISNPNGQAIVNNIVQNLFPNQAIRTDGLEYVFKTDNYTTQLSVYGAAKNEKIEVDVTPLSPSLGDLLDKGVAIKEAEGNRRFTFTIRDAGLYQVTVRKIGEDGNLISESVMYKTFSYSDEYNEFPDGTTGAEFLESLAEKGKGKPIEDPAQIFETFAKRLKKNVDPRVVFLILAIIFVLLDIAVRKFKFKWPHELIREYKQKKAEKNLQNK